MADVSRMISTASRGTFEADMDAFLKKFEDKANALLRASVLDIFKRIVMRTPVDTGRLRGNWQIDIRTPPASALVIVDKGGADTIAREAAKLEGNLLGIDIWIANNLVYALPIEEGHSKQAPAGMVRVSLMEFRSAVAQILASQP